MVCRFTIPMTLMLLVSATACRTDSTTAVPAIPTVEVAITVPAATDSGGVVTSEPTPTGHRYVLAQTDVLTLLDAQVAAGEAPAFASWATFAREGSPDNDVDGPRVQFEVFDASGLPTGDVVSTGTKLDVAGRTFVWSSDGDNQRTYVGPTPLGQTIAMLTLNVDEATAVDLLRGAEVASGLVVFDALPIPDGWVDTGTATAVSSFLAGVTGSSTPIGGTRSLYGDPTGVDNPTWDNIKDGFGVTLSTWPVTSADPTNEARYSVDGEVDVEVRRADGSTTTGFASPADSEFFQFVAWQDGSSWLALARPMSTNPDGISGLVDLAATVRPATPADDAQFELLTTD